MKRVQVEDSELRSSRRLLGRRIRDESGQALVEFLMVLPLLLILVFGIIEMGAAWRAYQVTTNTAREGARMAVVANGATYEEVLAEIDARLSGGGLDPDQATVEFLCDGGTNEACFGGGVGDATEARIAYPYTFIFLGPIARFMGGDGSAFGTVTMQTGIVMRNE